MHGGEKNGNVAGDGVWGYHPDGGGMGNQHAALEPSFPDGHTAPVIDTPYHVVGCDMACRRKGFLSVGKDFQRTASIRIFQPVNCLFFNLANAFAREM